MPSSSWIHDYHPTKLAELNNLDETIHSLQNELNNLKTNVIPELEEINENLKNISNLIKPEYVEETNIRIEDIGNRKAVVAPFESGQPVLSEAIDFSKNSICFILE